MSSKEAGMAKTDGSRSGSPYDLNDTLKDRKSPEPKSPSPSAKSPYTLSHESSLRAAVLADKKR